jgi:ElaB/YqjD/DUF883 family membrane-anchored ribosome-binding protein
MPSNALDAEAKSAAETAKRVNEDAQRLVADAAKKIEHAVTEGLEQLRAQSRTYADNAGQHLDEASRYMTERVKERPLAATGAALGVGVLIGLLLSAGRR